MPRTVAVPEYELAERVSVDPSSTALLVVDMQNDFVRRDGALPVLGAQESLPAVARLIGWARRRAMAVLFTQDSHREGDPEWEIWGRHAEIGTEGWEIVEELRPADGDLVFRKCRYDGFYGTDLDHQLRVRGIETLIVCGTVANICVHYTAASAALRWYQVVHPVDALSALTEFDMESALRQAAFLFGAVLTTTDGLVGEG